MALSYYPERKHNAFYQASKSSLPSLGFVEKLANAHLDSVTSHATLILDVLSIFVGKIGGAYGHYQEGQY